MTHWLHDRVDSAVRRWNAASPGRRAALLAGWCAILFLLVNWRNYSNDYMPLALVPVSLCRYGVLDLDVYRGYYESMPANKRYAFTDSHGHLYPMKPLFVSLLVVPLYVPPLLAGVPTDAVDFWVAWGRLANALLTGLAVALSYLAVRRWTSEAPAVGLTLLLTFGTCLWTTVGQSLNYHTGALLCVAALLVALDALPLTTGRAAWVGFLLGAAVGMRPTAVVLLFPLGVYLCLPGTFASWKARLAGLVGILVVPLLNLWMNKLMFGGWFATGYSAEEVDRWKSSLWQGAVGLLIAPNSGLLTQSPFLVLAVVGGWSAWTATNVPQRGLLRVCTLCFVSYWLLFSRWYDWQGGLTFASRMLSEGYPLLLPLLAVGWERVRSQRWALPFVVIAGTWAVLYQAVGVATFDAVSLDNPPHLPWQPRAHYYLLHVDRFGWLTTLGVVAQTLALLIGVAIGAFYVLRPFFLPRPQD